MEKFFNDVLWEFCTIALRCLVPLKEEVLLDSQFLLEKQVATEGKSLCTGSSYAPVVSIPGSGGLAHCGSSLQFGIP